MIISSFSDSLYLQGTKVMPCRFDWHQTGSQVIISIYAKNSLPELSYVEANSTTVETTETCSTSHTYTPSYL